MGVPAGGDGISGREQIPGRVVPLPSRLPAKKLPSSLFFRRRKLHKYRIGREFRVRDALLPGPYLDVDGARRVSLVRKSHIERRTGGYLHGTRRLTACPERGLRQRPSRIGAEIDG